MLNELNKVNASKIANITNIDIQSNNTARRKLFDKLDPTINLDQQVTNLIVTIRTGDDDVRIKSNVYANVIIVKDGLIHKITKNMNNGNPWPNGSTNEADIPIAFPVKLREIQGFIISFSSGSCLFCSTDNWNMDFIDVSINQADGSILDLFRMEDKPVHRFTGDQPNWSFAGDWYS